MLYSVSMTDRQPPSGNPSPSYAELARDNAELLEALEASRHEHERFLDNEQRLRAVVEHVPIVMFATDRHGIFTFSEGRGLEALGLKPGQVVGLSAFEVYRDFPKIAKNLRACLAGETVNDVVEVDTLVFESLYVPKRDSHGEVIGVSGFAWDVTARVRAEDVARDLEGQLRQSQKMETVGTLAGGIAHDFNNILSPILGFSELALTSLPEKHPARADIEQVMKAARRARDLVKQILLFSRRSDQEKHPVQLHLIVNEAMTLVRSMLPPNVEISQHVENQGDTVLADASQMHQIVMNLAVNAIYAMRETGGMLRIELLRTELGEKRTRGTSVLQPGPYVMLAVGDEGEGMDKNTLQRVFEPFFTTKPTGLGTGLGLSVVHGIVHSHGGAVEVRSRQNEGTTFSVYLPAVSSIDTRPPSAAPSARGGGGEHILIVDDEEPIMDLLRRILEARGYRVSAFTSSSEALTAFERQPAGFDAVITDQTMPRMSGLELAGAMRLLRHDVPVILTTGFVDRATLPSSGGHIAAVAAKPFDADVITALLRKVLDRR